MAQQYPVAVGLVLMSVWRWSEPVALGNGEDFSERLAEEAEAVVPVPAEPRRGWRKRWAWPLRRAAGSNA